MPLLSPGEGAVASPRIWSVSGLLLAAGDALAARFGAVAVRGELSGYTRAGSGHLYFTLKDDSGAGAGVRCAMFRRNAQRLDFLPQDGQQVEVRGRLAVYEARGELQLVVEALQRVGAGNLYEEFLRLRARLGAAGWFAAERKRPLPTFPTRIGVVTSLGAAALHDVLSALRRRAPQCSVVVYPTLVQGVDAPAAIAAALALANLRAEVDLLLLCRGGGSLEDLWAFNTEAVVIAVAQSVLPVVCGVGHETDVSLADLAADLRAPTPTAAAELAAPEWGDLAAKLAHRASRLQRLAEARLESAAQRLDYLALRLRRPSAILALHQGRLAALEQRQRLALKAGLLHSAHAAQRRAGKLIQAQQRDLARRSGQLDALGVRLAALDPHQVLRRGYTWVEGLDGKPVTSVTQVVVGQKLRAVWSDGSAQTKVTAVRTELGEMQASLWPNG